MNFLSNLTSLALGEVHLIKPLLPSLASQPNNDSTYINEAYQEKTDSFKSNDPLEEEKTQQEKKNNSFPTKQKELQDSQITIPRQGKIIFPTKKIFLDESEIISGTTNGLIESIKPVEKNILMSNLTLVDENAEKPFGNKTLDSTNGLIESIKPVEKNILMSNLTLVDENAEKPFGNKTLDSTIDVLQRINYLFESDENVLKLKNYDNRTQNKVEIQSVNPQSKIHQNILDNKNNNSGFYTEGSNPVKASTVKINIGRIEVRALYPEQVILSKTEQNKPQLSLNEYLRSFNEGKR